MRYVQYCFYAMGTGGYPRESARWSSKQSAFGVRLWRRGIEKSDGRRSTTPLYLSVGSLLVLLYSFWYSLVCPGQAFPACFARHSWHNTAQSHLWGACDHNCDVPCMSCLAEKRENEVEFS